MNKGVSMGLGRLIFALYVILGPAIVGRADPLPSVCRDDCCFSAQEKTDGVLLTLRGVSTFRYWGFRVYTGALYMPVSATAPDSVLGEIPKKLVLRYHRSVSVEQFVENSKDTLGENPQLSLEDLRPFLSRIRSMYVPVKEGDSYAITYNPAQGALSLFFNDRLLGTLTDRSFARAYFGIWLSDYSVSKRFTDELLGRDT
jgi:hypothetical protein